jgi:hypothetical protein
MTSTTMDLMWSSIPRQVAANASLVDKQHFKALWEVTLFLSGEGIIGYFIPRNMATQMGAEELKGIANKLRLVRSVSHHKSIQAKTMTVG